MTTKKLGPNEYLVELTKVWNVVVKAEPKADGSKPSDEEIEQLAIDMDPFEVDDQTGGPMVEEAEVIEGPDDQDDNNDG